MAQDVAGGRRSVSWGFVVWWLALLLLHAVNAGYYVGFAILYRAMPEWNLTYQLRAFSIGIAPSEYNGIGWTHAAVSTIHIYYALNMVVSSLFTRRLVFSHTMSFHSVVARLLTYLGRPIRDQHVNPASSIQAQARAMSISELVSRTASRTMDSIVGREGLFGVDSAHFDDVLVLREFFETSLQSYQAYRMTRLLPRLGFIRIYVALLVANCWCVPLLHRVFKDRRHTRRVLILLCDALLDMISSMGVTLLIFLHYAPQCPNPRLGFPRTSWINDEWFTSVYQEFQMMLVVSWGDMASRLVFALGLVQCMESIKDILSPITTETPRTPVRPSAPMQAKFDLQSRSKSGGYKVVDTATPTDESKRNRLLHAKHFVLHVAGPRFFVLWGGAILAIQVYAESRGTDWPCKLHLRPWFHTKPACSLVEINCNEFGLYGRATSLEAAWTHFDPTLTAHLTMRHCPELVVQPTIQQYHQIASMKVYNSTITSWSETAAITKSSHQNLRALSFVRTTFANATLPPGLISKDFPQSLGSFTASVSNLGSLPDDLHRLWPRFMSITLEASRFTAIPATILKLLPAILSFAQNPITQVSAELFEVPSIRAVFLCGTAIQELPRDVLHPSPNMLLVALGGTNVSTLWAWMDGQIGRSYASYGQYTDLYGSRFCLERAAIEAGTRTQFSAAQSLPSSALARAMDVSKPDQLAYSKQAIPCRRGVSASFPVVLEDMVSAMPT